MTVDLFDIDPLLIAHVEITFLQAAHADPAFAEAVQAFDATSTRGGE